MDELGESLVVEGKGCPLDGSELYCFSGTNWPYGSSEVSSTDDLVMIPARNSLIGSGLFCVGCG